MIATAYAEAFSHVEDAVMVAVASRSIDRARAFANTYGFKKFYGSYEELVNDPEIDVVYVATPHSHHFDNVSLALNAGKHVLCEKAFTVNALEAEKLIHTAREKKLFLMEAMWIRFLPHVKEIISWINDGEIGEVVMIDSKFGNGSYNNMFDPDHRLFKKELAGGAHLDLGIYPYALASMVLGKQPDTIYAAAKFNECGTDNTCNTLFTYNSGAFANLSVSFEYKNLFSANILGTRGSIEIRGFWWKDDSIILHRDNHNDYVLSYNARNKPFGYTYCIQEVIDCINRGKTESEMMTLDETLKLMQTMDKIRDKINLKYPADERF
jgi:dihydrodiol dehydrogenase / D-xylose 1-dehydrogenase (NADP)